MGWLSRTFGSPADPAAEGTAPAGGTPAEPPVPVPPVPAVAPTPTAATAGSATPAPAPSPSPEPSSPMGRYGPLVTVTRFDTAPPELEWQLPLDGELYRLMPGSDRPDYSLLVLDRPVHFYPQEGFDLGRVEPEQRVSDRKGRTMVRVHAMLLCARFVGQQLHPGMTDLSVNLAYVIDNSLARDAEVDFAKIEFAGVGFLSEGRSRASAPEPHAPPAPEDAPAPEVTPERDPGSRHTPSEVLDELARTLRQGIEQQRGVRVQRMTAALTVDPDLRLTGLSGNADGQAPVPTPETFTRLAEVLGRLAGTGERVAAVTLRVDGDAVTHEVTATHG